MSTQVTNLAQAQLVEGYEVVIGLEIHCQLSTQSKLFSGSPTEFGAEPNTQASAVDLALPGTLPVLNEAALDKALRFGLGVHAEISPYNTFARKNYFYPDLPKGYQTSQMDHPIVGQGYVDIEFEEAGGTHQKRVGITRAHLEEDAGKSLHDQIPGFTGIDLNRAGTPLLEIVSDPDMRSAAEALAYVRQIHTLVQWLDMSDGDMSQGSFRCDCNVSIRKPGAELGTRTELKNINSFKFIERAIGTEIERQIDLLEGGGRVTQETRLYDAAKDETRSMRSKEEAMDYRYFPCPDLLPVQISAERLEKVAASMPELPQARKLRFETELGLSEYDARMLIQSRKLADYFEDVLRLLPKTDPSGEAKLAANWIMGELSKSLNESELEIGASPVTANMLAGLLLRLIDDTVSGKIAKQVFSALWALEGGSESGAADQIIKDQGLKQESDAGAIGAMIDEVLANNQPMVDEFLSGKDKAFNGLIGQIMKASRGKANPKQVNELLREKLESRRD